MTQHSEAVLGAGLQVRYAALGVLLDLARLSPLARTDILHLHDVMFNLQTAVVRRRRPRQMATVLVYVEHA